MKRFSLILAVFVLLSVFATEDFGQTSPSKKRKPRRKTSTPTRVVPVSTQQIIDQNQPEIISQQQVEQTPTVDPNSSVTENQSTTETPTETSGSFQERIDQFNTRIREMSTRIGSLESSRKGDLDEKQRKLLLNLEILSRAEQRAEGLRDKLYSLTEKENSIKSEIEQVDFDSQDDVINRSIAIVGGMRPEEMREQRRRVLQNKKTNLTNLLSQIQGTKASLEENVVKADLLVDKLRQKLEKEIDDALNQLDNK